MSLNNINNNNINNNNNNINNNDLSNNNVLKNLYSTNFFEDIKVNINANILTIAVIENPVVQTIEFKGIKKNEEQRLETQS